jgi:hypothetical protein
VIELAHGFIMLDNYTTSQLFYGTRVPSCMKVNQQGASRTRRVLLKESKPFPRWLAIPITKTRQAKSC